MTAQQQLVDAINARGFDAPIIALRVIRDHGTAIAELIEAYKEFVEDNELLSHARIAAALRKLTQDE